MLRKPGENLQGGMETSETGFFGPDELPPLSTPTDYRRADQADV